MLRALRSRHKLFLLALLLAFLSILVVFLCGREYKLEFWSNAKLSSLSDLELSVPDCVHVKHSSVEDHTLTLWLEPTSVGNGMIEATFPSGFDAERVYVHPFGVITAGGRLGDATGDEIVPLSIFIFLVYATFLVFKKYKKCLAENLYQYRNITWLALGLFLSFSTFLQLFQIPHYQGLAQSLSYISTPFSLLSYFLLPLIVILSILVIGTGLVLTIKEGLTWRNFLAFLLGLSLFFATILPDRLNYLLQTATWIDVHNENSLAPFVQMFFEASVFMTLAYVECVFISALIITIKSARRVPDPDLDFLIILGCYVRPDGEPGGILKARIDRALAFSDTQLAQGGKPLCFICSGGQGSDEKLSEARACARYLLRHGIRPDCILLEEKSTTTEENMLFSADLLSRVSPLSAPRVAFVTSSYHVFRAGVLASDLGHNFLGLGAHTKLYFWINAFIREFVAEMVLELRHHLFTILVLLLLAGVSFSLAYLFH